MDNDNDGVPDGEDPDDDNNGVLDVDQELICFRGEEQSPWDHDNDGIPDWADTDWDGDGISNTIEQAGGGASHHGPMDHDNDGLRDDIDLDDDEDGMNDEDEVMLWPTRYGSNSTNPWDHDDYGTGAGRTIRRMHLPGPIVLMRTMTQTEYPTSIGIVSKRAPPVQILAEQSTLPATGIMTNDCHSRC